MLENVGVGPSVLKKTEGVGDKVVFSSEGEKPNGEELGANVDMLAVVPTVVGTLSVVDLGGEVKLGRRRGGKDIV